MLSFFASSGVSSTLIVTNFTLFANVSARFTVETNTVLMGDDGAPPDPVAGLADAERVAAQRPVDQARIAVKQAQAAYDLVHNDPNIGALPEAAAVDLVVAAAVVPANAPG